MEKGLLKFELSLRKHQSDSIFFLLITNTRSGQEYALKLDGFDIGGDRQLVNVFRTGEDVYREVIGDFEAIGVE